MCLEFSMIWDVEDDTILNSFLLRSAKLIMALVICTYVINLGEKTGLAPREMRWLSYHAASHLDPEKLAWNGTATRSSKKLMI